MDLFVDAGFVGPGFVQGLVPGPLYGAPYELDAGIPIFFLENLSASYGAEDLTPASADGGEA